MSTEALEGTLAQPDYEFSLRGLGNSHCSKEFRQHLLISLFVGIAYILGSIGKTPILTRYFWLFITIIQNMYFAFRAWDLADFKAEKARSGKLNSLIYHIDLFCFCSPYCAVTLFSSCLSTHLLCNII